MANEFKPLVEILRELKAYAARKASGFFFIVTDQNQSSTIRLRNGQIEDVVFSRSRNDEAVQLLAKVNFARGRFQPGAISASAQGASLSAAATQWLLGGFEHPLEQPRAAAPAAASATGETSSSGDAQAQRKVIENIALNYFGPIASVLCDEAFEQTTDVDQALAVIATNLPTPDDAKRFLSEARAGLASKR